MNGAPVIPCDDSSRFSKISWSTASNVALRSRVLEGQYVLSLDPNTDPSTPFTERSQLNELPVCTLSYRKCIISFQKAVNCIEANRSRSLETNVKLETGL